MILLKTMTVHQVLVTCPPMLNVIEKFEAKAGELGIKLIATEVEQTLEESELIKQLPNYDGWIIGDDPATENVFKAGKKGKLRAAVKWGIGVDNVDMKACERIGIPVTNTPGMFGREVADIAVGYVIALARHTMEIDRGVREYKWPKPCGISLADRKVALIGYGDIGRNTGRRLIAADMEVIAYDPYVDSKSLERGVTLAKWPERLEEVDFIVVNCALTSSSYHLLDKQAFTKMKKGVRIVNVGRGHIIDEKSLIEALKNGHVHSAALDVFETEPLSSNSELRKHKSCIFGSHNSSNTIDAVTKTSLKAIKQIADFLIK